MRGAKESDMFRRKYGEELRLGWNQMMEISRLGWGTGPGNDKNQGELSVWQKQEI